MTKSSVSQRYSSVGLLLPDSLASTTYFKCDVSSARVGTRWKRVETAAGRDFGGGDEGDIATEPLAWMVIFDSLWHRTCY